MNNQTTTLKMTMNWCTILNLIKYSSNNKELVEELRPICELLDKINEMIEKGNKEVVLKVQKDGCIKLSGERKQ